MFGDIAKARSALLSAGTPQEKIAANGQLDGALGRLLVVVENYPQLKSNENFLRLQDELAGTENRIAVERKRYNDTLRDYNTYVQQFPNSFFAGIAGSNRMKLTSKLRQDRAKFRVNFQSGRGRSSDPRRSLRRCINRLRKTSRG